MTPDAKNTDESEKSPDKVPDEVAKPKDLEDLVSGDLNLRFGGGIVTKVLVALMGLLLLGGVIFAVVVGNG